MSTLKTIRKFLFGDWVEAYITTTDHEYERLIGILKEHGIKYRVTVRKPTKENIYHNNNAYYIRVLNRDFQEVKRLIY